MAFLTGFRQGRYPHPATVGYLNKGNCASIKLAQQLSRLADHYAADLGKLLAENNCP